MAAGNRFYPPAAIASLAAMADAPAAEAPHALVTPAAYRDRTGIGRNLTIDVLEYFDRVGLTTRVKSGRRVLRPAAAVFGSAPVYPDKPNGLSSGSRWCSPRRYTGLPPTPSI